VAYGLLFLRVVVGATIGAHGLQKLLGWFGGGGPQGTAGAFASMGFRAAGAMAYLAALGESAGFLLAAGFLTPFAALGIVAVMVTATATVHWQNGFFSSAGGYEYNLTLIAVAVALAATGPGRFSVDRALGWDDDLSGLWWGVAVLAVGLAAGLVNATLLRTKPPAPAPG
jgi:putative oxidoreductase